MELEDLKDAPHRDPLLELFPILQDKTPEELEKLNRSVVRKLDWYFLPCITMILLMRYVHRSYPLWRDKRQLSILNVYDS